MGENFRGVRINFRGSKFRGMRAHAQSDNR